MDDLDSTQYYAERARREREMAEAAENPAVAAIHVEMATRYTSLVKATAAEERTAGSN